MERKRKLSISDQDVIPRKRTFSSTSATSDSAESTDTDSISSAKNVDFDQPKTSSQIPYSSAAQKMMQKMGYKAGKGLGKYETGRVDIIEASQQRGLRGLGLTLKGLEHDTSATWNEEDTVMIRQDPDWIPLNTQTVPTLDELNTWVTMSGRKETIDDEVHFIESDTLRDVLENKSLFDDLGPQELLRARSRANPYETIRSVIFQNRAAMKMAEIDASFDYMFTNHKARKQESSELLYFSDICAGPGGFSEYILWRGKWRTKGFGFTLRANGANDFALEQFIAGTPETFDCHYGEGGSKGDGDVYNEKNLIAFSDYVKQNTDNMGVHFVMADGGFSVEGKENIQEILSKQLYLCQFTCALSILRIGGHFVCKVFDLFTPFSVGLVYLMYRAFEKVCIFKPVTSRPANSERYIVCENLLKDYESIHRYMFDLNVKINNLKGSNIDIEHVVPLSLIKEDTQFFNYIFSSNNVIGERQVNGLRKLVTFIKNTSLVGANPQEEVKKQCLKAWNIPNLARSNVVRNDPEIQFEKLVGLDYISWMKQKVELLNRTILDHMKSAHDYKCMFAGKESVYLFGLGRQNVFQWNPRTHQTPNWTRIEQRLMELPRFTLIEVEFVTEFVGDGRGQRKFVGVHIIDVVYLGEEYVGDKVPTERYKYAESFAKSVSKPCRNDLPLIRARPSFTMNEIENMFNQLEVKQMKKGMERKLTYALDDGRYFAPIGVYFIPRLKHPWHLQYSRTSKRLYFYNSLTNDSTFEGQKTSIADVKYCSQKRLFWEMGKGMDSGNNSSDNENISKDDIINFVSSKQ